MTSPPLKRITTIIGGVVILSLFISLASKFTVLHNTLLKPVDFLSDVLGTHYKSTPTTVDIKKAEPPPPAFIDHDTLHQQKGFSTIENYYPDSNNRWASLCEKLISIKQKHHGRVRIAWLGDSQIEGDIFTQDVRRLLQRQYGGRGVGFVPIATHVPGFRKSIDFTFSKEWQTFSLADKKTRHSNKLWTLNGEVFIPSGDAEESINDADSTSTDSNKVLKTHRGSVSAFATARYTAVGDSFTKAMIIYKDGGNDEYIRYTLDNTTSEKATLPATGVLSTYTIKNYTAFKSIKFTIPTGTGSVYYGVSFDNYNGIILDNYSLRGAAGLHLMALKDYTILAYNKLFNYDLIVMQYGINVAKAGVHDYNFYKRDMEGVINRLHKLMPHTAILLVGISDKSAKHSGVYETMPEVEEVLVLQKQLAQKTGCAFWSAFDAMGGEGSMTEWADAKPSLANKDYTHFKPEGGKVLANYFNYAWMYEVNKYIWLKKHKRA